VAAGLDDEDPLGDGSEPGGGGFDGRATGGVGEIAGAFFNVKVYRSSSGKSKMYRGFDNISSFAVGGAMVVCDQNVDWR
jgi:hypothetical protein